jgi:NAD(P)-dependent dehydrogenase (short-subunit alcohol dehydrogenase family)
LKSAYVAAKHGLVGFSKVMALETAGADITVNTICPSYVKTPLVDRQIAEYARMRGISEAEAVRTVMLQPMPKRTFIGFDKLAGIAAFLVSSAARNITGAGDRRRRRLDGAMTSPAAVSAPRRRIRVHGWVAETCACAQVSPSREVGVRGMVFG